MRLLRQLSEGRSQLSAIGIPAASTPITSWGKVLNLREPVRQATEKESRNEDYGLIKSCVDYLTLKLPWPELLPLNEMALPHRPWGRSSGLVCLSHAPTRLQMPAWLGLESEVGGWAVMDSGGMARVLAEMEHPQNQYLLIHLFVGRTAKAQALRSLYPYNNTGRQGGLGFARLHYAPVTHPHTVIFIDGSLSRPTAKSCPRAPLRRYHIQNSTGRSYQEIQGLLYRCLLLPRADTWTLFADDIGGLCQVENLLAAWCAALSSDALEPTSIARPRLIVVLTDLRDTVGPLETLESTLRVVAVASLVASVRVLDLRDRALLSLVGCFEPLRRLLSQELDEAYLARRQAHELFSAIHLDWIWRKSLHQASRYLRLFLDTADRAGAASDTVTPYVASALLMDAYPLGMHDCAAACSTSQFLSESTFSPLVEAEVHSTHVCLLCLCRAPEHILPCEHAICDVCVQIFGGCGWGAEYHFELRSCPLCLARFSCVVRVLPPTKRLTILALDGGGVRGVVTLGFLAALEERIGGSRGLREAFDLNMGTSVGAVIVSEVIDLGRPAAMAHAKFRALAQQIFRPWPPRQTILAQMWDFLTTWVSDSRHDSNTLDRALQQAFDPARRLFGPAAPLVSGIRVALTASQVDDDGSLGLFCNYCGAGRAWMQSAYKLFLPEEREPRLWEVYVPPLVACCYFLSLSFCLIPSSTILPPLSFLHYPSSTILPPLSFLHYPSSTVVILLYLPYPFLAWASCVEYLCFPRLIHNSSDYHSGTTLLCSPCTIASSECANLMNCAIQGEMQRGRIGDGGVRANCPLRTALRESEIIWPTRKQPDLVISVGTGYAVDETPATAEPGCRWLRDGFIDRALQMFLHSLAVDGRRGWQDALDTVPAGVKGSIYRLDQQIPGKALELDDIRALDSLQDFAYTVPDELVRAWLAKTFFFELDGEPEKTDGSYRCHGSILCCKFDAPGIVC
ncbi:hypothetical protein CNMCM5878_008312 [Aspergillus fumigatiaffinis]|nr:hypothetical protein CNMCM5878_008312 [Aspergillus fumigatiaffinis]